MYYWTDCSEINIWGSLWTSNTNLLSNFWNIKVFKKKMSQYSKLHFFFKYNDGYFILRQIDIRRPLGLSYIDFVNNPHHLQLPIKKFISQVNSLDGINGCLMKNARYNSNFSKSSFFRSVYLGNRWQFGRSINNKSYREFNDYFIYYWNIFP